MATKNWFKEIDKLDCMAKREAFDPFANVVRTSSPSVNFTFGKGHGLPRGYSAIFYGPPGGGKSFLSNDMIGQTHKDYPNGLVLKFDTEFRDDGQLTPTAIKAFGIDSERYRCLQSNSPMDVFDTVEKIVPAMCQEGADIPLIVIDSLTGIRGRRGLDQASIEGQQIGDKALTLQTGLERIMAVQRRYHVAIVMTAHVGAEMDLLEQKRGNKVKMVAGFGTQHHAEYFLFIEMNRNKEARADILGKEFLDNENKDLAGNEDKTGHKIRACMKKNSMAPAGRMGEFTIDYEKGIVNVHEEVFLLGVNRGIIAKPNQQMYAFGGKEYRGKEAMVTALRDYPELAAEVVTQLRLADLAGKFGQTADEEAAASPL